MKAIHLHGRGGPDRLVYEDAPQPYPGLGEVLVRVHATSIIAAELTWNETYQTAAGTARSLPIPGHDVSGIVEEVGPGATTLARGSPLRPLIGTELKQNIRLRFPTSLLPGRSSPAERSDSLAGTL